MAEIRLGILPPKVRKTFWENSFAKTGYANFIQKRY